MLSKVEKFIAKNRLINVGDVVLVGLSGGPDSVALLHCLYLLKDKLRFRIAACHLHHHIRGKDADKDARFAGDFAEKLEIPFFTGNVHIPRIKHEQGGTIEEVARNERYKFFCKIAKKCGANKIALGHTADDTVETFLFCLIRGTGIKGLAGIPMKRKEGEFEIVRPLLGTKKNEILEFLNAEKLPYRTDTTNLEDKYTRNKIRLRLLPYLRKEFNPKITDAVLDTSRYLRECVDYMDNVLENIVSKFAEKTKNGFTVPLKEVKRLHPAIRIFLLRRLFNDTFCYNLNDEMLDVVHSLIEKEGRYNATLPKGISVSLEYGILKFAKRNNAKFPVRPVSMLIPFKKYFAEWNMELKTNIISIDKAPSCLFLIKKLSFGQIWQNAATGNEPVIITEFLDADDIGAKRLTLRTKMPGDRYKAFGKNGSCSLKKLFIDEKIPISIRHRIPILTAGNRIIYIAGHRIAESVKITAKTKKVLKLDLTIFPL
jgi:tRNA(Ile)-lysidine synthase